MLIASYCKIELVKDLKEYLKYKVIYPCDYIQVYRNENQSTESKLVACWLFEQTKLLEIKQNNSLNPDCFIDKQGIAINPYHLELMTIAEYFEEIEEKIN